MTSEERKELKKKRLEKYRKSSDSIRPSEAALLYPSVSIDYYYDHWEKELGGKIIKNGRKAIYMPVSRDKIERYLGISSQPTAEYFLNMSPDEIPQVANVFMPYLLNSLFENLQKFAYEKYYSPFSNKQEIPNQKLIVKNKESNSMISDPVSSEGNVNYDTNIVILQTGQIGKWIDVDSGKSMLAFSFKWGAQLDVFILGEWNENREERQKLVNNTFERLLKGNDEIIEIERSL